MAAFLDKIKVTSNGRISLGGAAMRNLALQAGDTLEVFFDETEKSLVIKKEAQGVQPSAAASAKAARKRNQDHGA